MRSIRNKVVVLFVALAIALGQIACGPQKIEKTIGNFTRAVKSARQITTVQHTFNHINDEEYVSRLKLFKSLYISIDTLGDKLVEFGEINDNNRAKVLEYIKDVNSALISLLNTGNLGVKDEAKKAEFTKWLLVASAGLSSIQIAVAAAKQPIPTKELVVKAPVE